MGGLFLCSLFLVIPVVYGLIEKLDHQSWIGAHRLLAFIAVLPT